MTLAAVTLIAMTAAATAKPLTLPAETNLRAAPGTKSEIIQRIRELADSGKAVIVISSELAELLAVSDRVLVLRNGTVTDDLDRRDIDDEESLQLAIQGVRS